MGNIVYGSNGGLVYANSPETGSIRFLNTATIGPVSRPDSFHDAVSKSTAEGLLLEGGNQAIGLAVGTAAKGLGATSTAVQDFVASGGGAIRQSADNALENAWLSSLKLDAGAIQGFKKADDVNALMTSTSWAPAWQSGTTVAEAVIPPGTRVQMVVDENTYLAYLDSNKKNFSFGGWATFDNIPSQSYARNQLATTTAMKENVGYVIEVEVTQPISAQIGRVGAQDGATGGGSQLHFVITPAERGSVFKVVGERKLP